MKIMKNFATGLLIVMQTSASLQAQHVVGGCITNTSVLTENTTLLKILSSGNFINKGTIHYDRVTHIENNGGFSDSTNQACQAVYADLCSAIDRKSDVHIFDNTVSKTIISGTQPLRMTKVLLNRNIHLSNEWQIADSLVFQQAIIQTDRSNKDHFLHFLNGAVAIGNSDSGHVDGYVAYSGKDSIWLPIGDSLNQHRIHLDGTCGTLFKAAWFGENPAQSPMLTGDPANPDNQDSSIQMISGKEFWDVSGVSHTKLSFEFDQQSFSGFDVTDFERIVIVGWTGTTWDTIGKVAYSGQIDSIGTISTKPVKPEDYQAFTFGLLSCSAVLTSAGGSAKQSVCEKDSIQTISYKTIGANGINTPQISGLPSGVSANWNNSQMIISGTPTQTGTFDYAIPLVDNCGNTIVRGQIIVHPKPNLTISAIESSGTTENDGVVCSGDTLTFQTSVSEGTTNTYIWQWSLPDLLNDPSSAHPKASPPAGDTTFRATVINENGCKDTASIFTTIQAPFDAGTIDSTTETICYNQIPLVIGSAEKAAGGDQQISYKWEYSLDSFQTQGITILNASTDTLLFTSGLTEVSWFRRLAKDGACQTTFVPASGIRKISLEKLPPTAKCKDATLYLNASGHAQLTLVDVNNESTDNCSGVRSLSLDKYLFDCADRGKNAVILTVQDSVGNVDTCVAQVTLLDTMPPVDVCQQDYQIILLWEGTRLSAAALASESMDNCGVSGLRFSFDSTFTSPNTTFFCADYLEEYQPLTIYVKDKSGNISSCSLDYEWSPEGIDCACTWGNLKLKGTINSNEFHATESIVATGEIAAGEMVELKAGKTITFSAGFHAKAGSYLLGNIDPCTNNPKLNEVEENIDTEYNRLVTQHPVIRHNHTGHLNRQLAPTLESAPNPFHQATNINLFLPNNENVTLVLRDFSNNQLLTFFQDKYMPAGNHQFTIDGTNLPAGIYFIIAQIGKSQIPLKLMRIP